MLDGKSNCCLLVAKAFSASFYVFEMLIGKLMKDDFSDTYMGLPTFLLLFYLKVVAKTHSDGTPPPPPKAINILLFHVLKSNTLPSMAYYSLVPASRYALK